MLQQSYYQVVSQKLKVGGQGRLKCLAHSSILCKGISLDSNNFSEELKFLSYKNHTPFLRYSAFYILNHSINFESYDFMMSIGTLALAQIIECIFWILSHLVIKLSQLIDRVMGPKSKPNFSNLLQPKPIMMRFWFFSSLQVCIETIKNSKHPAYDYSAVYNDYSTESVMAIVYSQRLCLLLHESWAESCRIKD